MAKRLGDEWRAETSKLEEAGVNMRDIADKPNFGVALDQMEKRESEFGNMNSGDDEKFGKERDGLKLAIRTAATACGQYTRVLYIADQNVRGNGPDAARARKALGGAIDWLTETKRELAKRMSAHV